MSNWLYKAVLQEDNLGEPTFACQSTINWMKAIRFKIDAEIDAEEALVVTRRELIERFEKKIQATLACVWGEDS